MTHEYGHKLAGYAYDDTRELIREETGQDPAPETVLYDLWDELREKDDPDDRKLARKIARALKC